MKRWLWLAIVLPLSIAAQDIDWSVLDRIGQKARKSAEVNIGAEQLALLAGAKGKVGAEHLDDLVKQLKSVFVRNFEFDAPGMYDMEVLRSLRDKVKSSGQWLSLVSVKEGDGFTEIMMKKTAEGKPGGLLIIAAEPKEVSVVHVDGISDLSALGKLGGIAGIPAVASAGKKPGQAAAPESPKTRKE